MILKKNLGTHTARIALIALLSATLTAGKIALASIPNIEVVTLLLASYGYVFGFCGVAASFIFVATETLIWGAGTWIITYALYWPALAFAFFLLGKAGKDGRIVSTLTACLFTVWFGVLSSLVDTGLFTGFYDDFFHRFAIMYVRGGTFYITQIACNAALFLSVYKPLVSLLARITPSRFRQQKKSPCGSPVLSDDKSDIPHDESN